MSLFARLAALLPRAGTGTPAAPAGTAGSPLPVPGNNTQHAARAAFDAGLAAYSARDFAVAADCFNRAIEHRHDDADAHNNLGLSYLGSGRAEDAMDAFVLAVHYRPRFPQALYNMALAALQLDDVPAAIVHLEAALELDPRYAGAHSTLGYLLSHETGDFERGAAHIRTALELSPANPDVLCNYSAVLTQEGRAGEALEICGKLLVAYPAMHEARLNRALAGLKLGRFEEAWPDYEARKVARGNYVQRALPWPEWRGEPLHERKLLVYAEQGLGDQIMFASCVPDVLARAGRCMVECAPALVSLFRRSFPSAMIESQAHGDAALVRLARGAEIDCQTAIGSLPAELRRQQTDFPVHQGYLRADPARIAYWKTRLSELGPGLKIGISWRGGASSTRGASRSTDLADWLPILQLPGCRFVNLQYGEVADELHAIRRKGEVVINDWREAIVNYDETAALVMALDLVISVQTALVHLAGALGKRAWVMLRSACEWRYGTHGETMPWYPAVRLLRQPHAGDWQSVISRIARDAAELARD